MKKQETKREMLVLTQGDLDVTLESKVNVPLEFVYKAHSDPLLIPKWWGPAKYETTVEEMDFRPGGKWRYVQRDSSGKTHVFFGEYREIEPLKKITWTFRYEPYPDVSVETVEFIALNKDQTKIQTRSTYPSKETRDAVLKSGMESGYRESLDRLEKINFMEINHKKISKKTSIKSKKVTTKKDTNNVKIILNMTMTLDGFIAGPNNELDWMANASNQDPEEIKDNLENLRTYDSGIMGYPTVQGMVYYWKQVEIDPKSSNTERDIAKIVNNYHVYALSTKEEPLPSENTEIFIVKNDKDIIEAVKNIKTKEKRNIGIAGGIRTAQTLSRLGLIDEYLLTIYPVAIGSGKPLFTDKINLELLSSKTYKNGIMRCKYRPITNRKNNS